MNDVAISVRNLSKKYRRYASALDSIKEVLHPLGKNYHTEFWALKDISFEVKRGETIGIIGRNGSGKSTLLQIICGILQPTTGSVQVNGRVSALLELGAGFNPEFTGRENVNMNGAIMGFTKEEMDKKFQEIADFADIGDFIDQPVRTYSSGMFVRLAFAAAINVEPDILFVDEALAVGDAKFQHKCYNKFLEFQKFGKTILFVTHDMEAIVKHCDSAILLESGTISRISDPNSVINHYYKIILGGTEISSNVASSNGVSINPAAEAGKHELDKFLDEIPITDQCIYRRSYNKNEDRFGDRRAEIVDYLIVCKDNFDPTIIQSGDKIDLYIKINFHNSIGNLRYGFLVKTVDGVKIYGWNTQFDSVSVGPANGSNMLIIKFSIKMNLAGGDFFIDIGFDELINNNPTTIDKRNDFIHLFVQAKKIFTGIVELECSYEEIKVKQLA